MTALPNFLGDETVKLPVGGDFVPTGFVAPWTAAVMSSFLTEVGLKEKGIAFDAVRQVGTGGWMRYYFHEYDAAVEAGEEAGQQYGPRSLWVFECETAKVVNFATEEARQAFGTRITYDGCRVVTLRSKKYRHEFHMVALPAAVAAYATALGYDNPGFDLSALTSRDTAFTDELYAKLCGDPDTNDYESGMLWREGRVNLWAALGEPNAKVYNPIGTGTKFDTESEKLSKCLRIAAVKWTQPVWARVIPVFNPKPDETYEAADGTVKRLTIPTLAEMFADKATARAAVEAEQVEAGTPAGGSALTVPTAWAGSGEHWKSAVRGLKGQGPKPVVLNRLCALSDKELYDEVAATVAEVEAWWDEV